MLGFGLKIEFPIGFVLEFHIFTCLKLEFSWEFIRFVLENTEIINNQHASIYTSDKLEFGIMMELRRICFGKN